MKLTSFLVIIVIAAGALYAYERLKGNDMSRSPEVATPATRTAPAAPQYDRPWGQQPADVTPVAARSSSYRCDGRTHCSQMRSCDEAKYFIRHCPNTTMDGDGDGIPCENQWCGH